MKHLLDYKTLIGPNFTSEPDKARNYISNPSLTTTSCKSHSEMQRGAEKEKVNEKEKEKVVKWVELEHVANEGWDQIFMGGWCRLGG